MGDAALTDVDKLYAQLQMHSKRNMFPRDMIPTEPSQTHSISDGSGCRYSPVGELKRIRQSISINTSPKKESE